MLLLVLRVVLFGVGGGKGLTDFFREATAGVPNPVEYLNSIGISPAAFLVVIPLYSIANGAMKKAPEEKKPEKTDA